MAIDIPQGYGPVGLDTPTFIYYLREHPDYIDPCAALFDQVAAGAFNAVTSVVALLELLVYPVRQGEGELAAQLRDIFLDSSGLVVLDVDETISEQAAELRAWYRISAAGALQIATAIQARARAFVTTDRELERIQELPVILL